MIRRTLSASVALAAAAFMLVATAGVAHAVYPTNSCVSTKQKAASKFCKLAFKAWSKYQRDPSADPGQSKLNGDINKAGGILDKLWDKADSVASKKDVDCTQTTVDKGTAEANLTAAIDAVQSAIMAGNDASSDDLKCRSSLIKAAGVLCSGTLKGEAVFIKSVEKDPDGNKRTTLQGKALDKFNKLFDKATAKAGAAPCASLVAGDIIDDVNGVSDDITHDTEVSPVTPTVWTMITPGLEVQYNGQTLTPRCSRDDAATESSYVYFVKKGTVNKLLVYYQGGGACWNDASCNYAVTFKEHASAGDNPANFTAGFGDMSNPDNPFKDWNAVFITYCTGDIHWGNATRFYHTTPGENAKAPLNHFGRINAEVVEQYAREHFVNPDEVFVTGSSAGAYGAIMNGIYLKHDVYPQSKFNIMGDAGAGVIPPGWISNVNQWNVNGTLPRFVPGLETVSADDLTIVDVWALAAEYFSKDNFAQYTTNWDGSGGGQSAFYNVQLNDSPPNSLLSVVSEWPKWWQNTCGWHDGMEANFSDTEALAPANFRSYVGAGSRHTTWGSDKVYTSTKGGIPTLVDWIAEMRANSVDSPNPSWVSEQCADCSLVDTCQGGPSAGLPCTQDADCDSAPLAGDGDCEFDPRPPLLCRGGVDDGNSCTLNTDCDSNDCNLAAPYELGTPDTVVCP